MLSKEEVIHLPRRTKRKYPLHGQEVEDGRLIGQTATDHFYFLCPHCEQIMQAEPLKLIRLDQKNTALHIGLHCSTCRLTELVKIPSGPDVGWWGGTMKDVPSVEFICQRTSREDGQIKRKTISPSEEKLNSRKRLPPKKRFNLMFQHGFRCFFCGRSPAVDGVKLVIDHIEPKAAGGPDDEENLVPACEDCNGGKGKTEILPK